MRTKLIQYNVPANDIKKLKSFYSKVFGHVEFARSLTSQVTAYHMPVSRDGLQFTITQRHSAQEPPIAFISVEKLSVSIEELIKAGGSVMVEPFDLPLAPEIRDKYYKEFQAHHPEKPAESAGRAAILRDPEGNLFGLTELDPQGHYLFKTGPYQENLDDDQLAQHERALVLGKELEKKLEHH